MGIQNNETSARASTIIISIPMEEGDPLGATPNEKLTIVKIQPGTLADRKLQIGDQIIALNGVKLKDHNHLNQLLPMASPIANITIIRDEKKSHDMLAEITIPKERERNIIRREGYIYQLVIITLDRRKKVGLSIRHFQNRVLVCNVEPLSMVSNYLKIGDHICDVDGLPVTDKDVCRQLLLSQLQANKKVSLVIERSNCKEAKEWVNNALQIQISNAPSIKMNDDVKRIALRERSKIKNNRPPKKSLLTRGQSTISRSVNFEENVIEHQIISDNVGKQLRRVRKE